MAVETVVQECLPRLHLVSCNTYGDHLCMVLITAGHLASKLLASLCMQVQCHSSLEFLATLRVMPTLVQSLQVSRCLVSMCQARRLGLQLQ